MIGIGTIVIKRSPNQNELHFVSPWELSLALNMTADKVEINKNILKDAKEWKPDDTVDDAELEVIRKSKTCVEGKEGYHKYASDIIHVIDLTQEDSNAENA